MQFFFKFQKYRQQIATRAVVILEFVEFAQQMINGKAIELRFTNKKTSGRMPDSGAVGIIQTYRDDLFYIVQEFLWLIQS
jgi:hypothetical protein